MVEVIDRDLMICQCNNLTVEDIAKVIKENGYKSLDDLLDQDICLMGDKCEACRDEGYENDGMNLPLVLSLVKRGAL
ncbi:MAG: (2Fe-2S)-binding protein [Hydrogenimonas sp.]|nr:(2Fe-2S)-binding protein [Hydrogenimonas sp.]